MQLNVKYIKGFDELKKEYKKVMELQPTLQTIFNEVDNQLLEKFFKKLLHRGNDNTKDETADVVKDCYDNREFDIGDVIKISKETTKQDELFDYVEAPHYYKDRVRDYDEDEYDKDNFDLSR